MPVGSLQKAARSGDGGMGAAPVPVALSAGASPQGQSPASGDGEGPGLGGRGRLACPAEQQAADGNVALQEPQAEKHAGRDAGCADGLETVDKVTPSGVGPASLAEAGEFQTALGTW